MSDPSQPDPAAPANEAQPDSATHPPGRVLGIGGVFLRADKGPALQSWYADNLAVPIGPHGFAQLPWLDPDSHEHHSTTWSTFARDSDYFDADQQVMINYVVDDLDAVLARLASQGSKTDTAKGVESYDYGRFAWCWDAEGNKIELWEPNRAWIDKARAEGGW